MGSIPTITVDMDKICAECGKGGACESGICLGCTGRALSGRTMRSIPGKAVQRRAFDLRNHR